MLSGTLLNPTTPCRCVWSCAEGVYAVKQMKTRRYVVDNSDEYASGTPHPPNPFAPLPGRQTRLVCSISQAQPERSKGGFSECKRPMRSVKSAECGLGRSASGSASRLICSPVLACHAHLGSVWTNQWGLGRSASGSASRLICSPVLACHAHLGSVWTNHRYYVITDEGITDTVTDTVITVQSSLMYSSSLTQSTPTRS